MLLRKSEPYGFVPRDGVFDGSQRKRAEDRRRSAGFVLGQTWRAFVESRP
jgi:hypothetical protein